MFRILQGDVGSGKTIVSFLAAAKVVESGSQCALMAPTEILAKQHFDLAKKIFCKLNIQIGFLTGKTESSERKKITKEYEKEESYWTKRSKDYLDSLLGTLVNHVGLHDLFQNTKGRKIWVHIYHPIPLYVRNMIPLLDFDRKRDTLEVYDLTILVVPRV